DDLEHGRVGDVEAGGDDEGVDIALGAVGGDDRMRTHLADAVGDHIDVGPVEGGVVVVRDEHPLAADGEVRGDLLPQRAVTDTAAQVQACRDLQRLEQRAHFRQPQYLCLP